MSHDWFRISIEYYGGNLPLSGTMIVLWPGPWRIMYWDHITFCLWFVVGGRVLFFLFSLYLSWCDLFYCLALDEMWLKHILAVVALVAKLAFKRSKIRFESIIEAISWSGVIYLFVWECGKSFQVSKISIVLLSLMIVKSMKSFVKSNTLL